MIHGLKEKKKALRQELIFELSKEPKYFNPRKVKRLENKIFALGKKICALKHAPKKKKGV